VPNAPTLYAQVVPETTPRNATVYLKWVPANASNAIGLQYTVFMSKDGGAPQVGLSSPLPLSLPALAPPPPQNVYTAKSGSKECLRYPLSNSLNPPRNET
jgi:hypothetical protein